MSAQNYCKSIGGNLPVLRQWEYMCYINEIVKPLPVYFGVTQVNYISSLRAKYSGENKVERRNTGELQQGIDVRHRGWYKI